MGMTTDIFLIKNDEIIYDLVSICHYKEITFEELEKNKEITNPTQLDRNDLYYNFCEYLLDSNYIKEINKESGYAISNVLTNQLLKTICDAWLEKFKSSNLLEEFFDTEFNILNGFRHLLKITKYYPVQIYFNW